MGVFEVILIVFAILMLGGFAAMLCYTIPVAKKVYHEQLVRTSEEKWGRVCSCLENEEQVQMWEAGLAWAESKKEFMTEVEIDNDGMHFYGEYYDFKSDRTVIILPGRCECLKYSYFFSPPYEKAGLNVLVIDTRCHGKSDGKYNTIGLRESGDVLAWAKFLKEKYGTKEIWLHGICVGTSAAVIAMTGGDCPDYIKGLITDGCFVSFRETFKRHMIADKRPLFPVLDLVMLNIWKYSGTNVYKYRPIKLFKNMPKDKRILFLFGEKDIYSIPKMSRRLYAACPTDEKKLVWFKKGAHSHLRINNPEEYDNAIGEFLN